MYLGQEVCQDMTAEPAISPPLPFCSQPSFPYPILAPECLPYPFSLIHLPAFTKISRECLTSFCPVLVQHRLALSRCQPGSKYCSCALWHIWDIECQFWASTSLIVFNSQCQFPIRTMGITLLILQGCCMKDCIKNFVHSDSVRQTLQVILKAARSAFLT